MTGKDGIFSNNSVKPKLQKYFCFYEFQLKRIKIN